MNLALESIIRNKAIQNLFKTPTTIGVLNRKKNYLWITLETKNTEVEVSYWDLSTISSSNYMPKVESRIIDKEVIFLPEVVIPSGYFPIKYMSKSVDSDHNSYKNPMIKEIYESYHDKMFNTEIHQAYKKSWLWCIFANQAKIDTPDRSQMQSCFDNNDTENLFYYFREELNYCRRFDTKNYNNWNILSKILLLTETSVAGELIFSSLFPIP